MYQRRSKAEAAKGKRVAHGASIILAQSVPVKAIARTQDTIMRRSLRLWKKRSKLAHSPSNKEVMIINID